MPERRTLQFKNLDEAMAEVDRLVKGHATLGRWSLGQICNHLSSVVIYSVEGFPGGAPWIVRRTFGPVVKRRVLKSGRLPGGLKLPDKFQPRAGLDARAEAEALRASIRLFSSATGPLVEHPFFGRLTADEWRRIHAIHAAHHLGFVVPDPSTSG